MFRCGGCRTAFVEPMPSAQFLTDFYNRFHASADAGGWYDEVEARMQADFPAKIALVQCYTQGRPGRLLDVGCGKGFFVKACQEAGIEAEGIDLSQSGVDYATKVLNVKAVCAQLGDWQPDGLFDTATFWATIEHLSAPVQMLADIQRVLRPGGLLLLDTGIGNDWLDRTLPGVVQWYDPPQHLFVFCAGPATGLGARRIQGHSPQPLLRAHEISPPGAADEKWPNRAVVAGGGQRGQAAAWHLRSDPLPSGEPHDRRCPEQQTAPLGPGLLERSAVCARTEKSTVRGRHPGQEHVEPTGEKPVLLVVPATTTGGDSR